MSAVRKNTLVVDFSVLPERPKLDMVQRFAEKSLGLNPTDLRSIQLHNIRHCVLIQMADPAAAVEVAVQHHLKHAFRISPTKKIAIPVYVDDDIVDVRIHDLPPDMSNMQIAEAMLQYGEVLTIRDEVWRDIFAGVPNGVRVLKMKISKPVPSYVTICGLSSLATHTGQISTCRRCGFQRHVSKSCSEVAKKQQPKPKPQKNPSPSGPVLPIADLAAVQSQVVVPHTHEDNGNDGFITVVKKGKTKRQLEEKQAPEEKRSCLDDDNDGKSPTLDNDQRNDNGHLIGLPTTTTPKRRVWKQTV
ncbi:uncharacterized protein LOC119766080 [Culex quinquefasciatus]|uniref:uncharacterized protein LOC119766080 n=1 Tax=Culex quinquefasciatus TaxID=7176 RepID=UPI00016D91FA|nr:uncharacterized protein LOC119766080 [Culex quinquefasciatus]